jgi:Tol biopolymer transport system component
VSSTLSSGERFGEYEILGTLGAGGMGVVYRARDLRLRREVAIKTLKAGAPQDEEGARRILQEARRAASLNHPNICTIHEVGDGIGGRFIVMEFVDGRTLTSMIPPDGMPQESVAAYGAQIADALAHAHERGLLHRDIKSSNVIVTPSGQVKVLDFGIAAPTPAAAGEATTEASAEAGPAGTLAYMAPEVIRGQPADERSDIWSLGVLLYEMAAGRRPFDGPTAMSVAGAILHEPLPPLTGQVSSGVRAVILRCVQRQPSERYQRAAEVRSALEVVKDAILVAEPSSVSVPGAVHRAQATRWRAWALPAGLAAIAAVAVSWLLFTSPAWGPPRLSNQRAVALFGGSYRQSSLSPDGALVAFVDVGSKLPQVWVKNLAGGDPIAITTGDVAAANPAWSPANDQIVFERRRQGLWSVSPLGGPPRRLLDFGERPRFSGNGERLVFERNRRQIWTCLPDGSNATRVTGVPEPWYTTGMNPALSPDGRWIVYFIAELGPNGDLWVVPATGGQPRRLTHDLTEASDPIWTADGRHVIFSSLRGGSRTLWRVAADGGTPEPVTIGAGDDIEPALSRDNSTLLFTNFHNQWRLMTSDVSPWQPRELVERRTELLWPRFSPDGGSIAFFGRGQFGDVQIFVIAADGQGVRQLTRGRGQINTMPRWSPDGARIYFFQNRPSDAFFSMPAAGGASELVAKWPWESYTYGEVAPDGHHFLYFRGPSPADPTTKPQLVVEELPTSSKRPIAQPLSSPRWSPDGRMIAGHSRATPPMVTLCPVDGTACRPLTQGMSAVWDRDGSRIYFLRDGANPQLKQLWSIGADGGNLQMLSEAIGPFRPIDVTFDVSARGQVAFTQLQPGPFELWQAELR